MSAATMNNNAKGPLEQLLSSAVKNVNVEKVQNNDRNVSFMRFLGPSKNPNVHISFFFEGWVGGPNKET